MPTRLIISWLAILIGVMPGLGLAQDALTIDTVAGGGVGSNGDGGRALNALLQQANGLASANGNIYIAETATHRIRRVDRSGVISTIAGTGISGFSGDGGAAQNAQLNSPYGLATDGQGNLYVADFGNARVRRIAMDGTITTIAGGGSLPPGGANEGKSATGIRLNAPRNVTAEDSGILYISDFTGHRVFRLALDGTLTTFAGTGTPGSAGDGGPATQAQLAFPSGLTLDFQNALYIADSQNHSVRKVTNGVVTTVFQGTSPTGVALDFLGSVWVADAGAGALVQYPLGGTARAYPLTTSAVVRGSDFAIYATSDNGGSVTRVTQAGTASLVAGGLNISAGNGDGGSATGAVLNHPVDVAIDSAGNLLVADRDNNTIRRIGTDGIIATLAGASGLVQPSGISSDTNGNVYIADTGNHRVVVMNSAGTVQTLAGAPSLTSPVAAVADGRGNVYVADTDAGAILKIDAAGKVTTVKDGLARPHGLALRSGVLYFTEEAGPNVSQLNLATGAITRIASGIWNVPRGIAVSKDGALFVADTGRQQVIALDSSGNAIVLAGTGAAGFSGDGGLAVKAQLGFPYGVALNSQGDLYIADFANNRVRRVKDAVSALASSPTSGGGGGTGGGSGATLEVLNGASLQPGPIAPGMLLVLRGSGIPVSGQAQTSVLINSILVPIVSMSDNEIRLQAPVTLAAVGQVAVTVVQNGAIVSNVNVSAAAVNPALFESVNNSSNPVTRGSVITLYGTGLGLGDLPLTVSIGGAVADIVSLSPAAGYPGLFQINARVPQAASAGAVGVTLSVGGVESQAGVQVSLN